MTLTQAFPLAFYLLLAELAIGSFLVLLLADFEGEVGRGFLGLNGLIFVGVGLVALWARTTYPQSDRLAATGIQLEWVGREGRGFAFFLLFLTAYHVLTWFPWPLGRRLAGSLAAVAGVLALVSSGVAYGWAPWGAAGTIASFLAASLVLGGAMTGMLLGHWYLVTPLLSPRPLRHMTIVLFGALTWQLVSLPVYLGWLGPQAATARGAELLGRYGLILGVRVALGLVFPLVLAALAWHTTRIKAMRSATGLLYIGIGVVLTGEITAKVLFFLGRIPV
jgi:DMSO reductase anchor subunit